MGSKSRSTVLAFVVGVGLVAGIAVASNVHFVGSPSCTESGGTLTCSGSLAGLGSQTTVIEIEADFQCTNRGGNQPPGHASGQSEPIPPKNGRVNFSVSASGDCPGPMTPDFGGGATITASQDGSQVFSASIPISD